MIGNHRAGSILKVLPRPTFRPKKKASLSRRPCKFKLAERSLLPLLLVALDLLEKIIVGGVDSHDHSINHDFCDTSEQSINPATAGLAWCTASSTARLLPGVADEIDCVRSVRIIFPGEEGRDKEGSLGLGNGARSVLSVLAMENGVADLDVADVPWSRSGSRCRNRPTWWCARIQSSWSAACPSRDRSRGGSHWPQPLHFRSPSHT